MTTITRDVVRSLATRPVDGTIVSVYVDVDGRRRPRPSDVGAAVGALLDRARERGAGPAVDHVRAWFADPVDRRAARGVAVFADETGVLGSLVSTRPFEDQVTVGPVADLRQLEDDRHTPRRFVAALVDRSRARLLRLDGDRIEDELELVDPKPRQVDDDDGGGKAGGFQRQIDEAALRHLRHAARALVEQLRRERVDGLILGGPDEAVSAFVAELPADTADLVIGRVAVRVAAGEREVADRLRTVVDQVDRERRGRLVRDLEDRVGVAQGAVGLGDVLRALSRQAAATFLVERGYQATGSRCDACGLLALQEGPCPACSGRLVAVDDIVPLAAASAVAQDAEVHLVEPGALGEHRHIGVSTRF